MRKFTPEEDQFLWDNYLTIPAKRLSAMLNRTESTARQRMKLLRIVVPPEVVERFRKESQFKKGQTPPNKGKKMPPELYEKCKATMFKKGQLPHNTAATDGEVRMRRDKSGKAYKYIRVALGHWELYHRVIWEQAHGPIPEGMLVVFKDGDSMNCELDNLEMITMEENMARNTLHRFPAELKDVIRLSNKIKRKLHEHKQTGAEQHNS